MKAFLMGCVVAICVAVVGAWVLQDFAAESSAEGLYERRGADRLRRRRHRGRPQWLLPTVLPVSSSQTLITVS